MPYELNHVERIAQDIRSDLAAVVTKYAVSGENRGWLVADRDALVESLARHLVMAIVVDKNPPPPADYKRAAELAVEHGWVASG